MSPSLLWTDSPPSSVGKEAVRESISTVKKAYTTVAVAGTIGWFASVYIVYDAYGSADSGSGSITGKLWTDIWVDANSSVAFMTIDTIVLYIGVLLAIAFQSLSKVAKAIALTPFMGPAAASLVLGELEETRHEVVDASSSKKHT